MLEDQIEDILGKAMRGLGTSLAEYGINKDSLSSLSPSEVETLASKLNLDAQKLLQIEEPFKHTYLPLGLHCMTSEFGEMGVNCFVLNHGEHQLLFDTGTQKEMVEFVEPTQVFITHNHPDHVACLGLFGSVPVKTPADIQPGETFSIGDLTIQTFDASGHCFPSLAYYITGLETPVCIVGDSLFKRSMGGCADSKSYQQALANNRHLLNTLPPETILCVGHGPNTTIAEERQSNPFF